MFYPKRTIIPAIIASTLIGTHATIPTASASGAEQSSSKNTAEMESAKNAGAEDSAGRAHALNGMAKWNSKEMQAALTDSWLDGKLETALLLNEELNSFAIDTDVENGTVFLTGSVASDIERDLVHEIAQSIDGIEHVENKLIVDETRTAATRDRQDERDEGFRDAVANATITARIKSELLVNANTSGLSINVSTKDKKITLNGTVDSDEEKQLAEKIAQNAAGERNVENNLSVARTS